MGQLVEQPIPTLFGGVSRQPDLIRMTNQVEDGDNALFSVVTGGFEKRPASKVRAVLTTLDMTKDYLIHAMDISLAHRYFAALDREGNVLVFDARTGEAQTVLPYSDDVKSYIAVAAGDISEHVTMTTVNDTTFIVNKKKKVQVHHGATVDVKGTAEKFEDLPEVNKRPKDGEIWVVRASGEANTDRYYKFDTSTKAWALKYGPVNGSGDSGLPEIGEQDKISGEVWEVADLPEAPPPDPKNGDVWKISSPDTKDVAYYVKWDEELGKWLDIADPTYQNEFVQTTMPHAIIRNDETNEFTVEALPFNPREVGDPDTVPFPKFVGRKIQDIFFFKNRLGVVSEEWVTLSRSGDFYNFYKEQATEALDTDPVDRSAKNKSSVHLDFAIPFRKTVMFTSERSQFELSSDNYITPKDAAVDLSTEYQVSIRCRPVLMGDELYMVSDSRDRSVLFEYFYDDQTISNTAADVTKHVKDYVPPNVVRMAASTNEGLLYCYSVDNPSGLYVYSVYWEDTNKKAQSAWAFWDLGFDKIHEFHFMDGELYIFGTRGGVAVIESISPVRDVPADGLPFDPLLDGREVRTDGVLRDGHTEWILPYAHGNKAAVVLGEGTKAPGKTLSLSYPGARILRARGNFAGQQVYIGMPYKLRAKLSKIYLREGESSSIITGRLQLRHMVLHYENTGYFEVRKKAVARDTKRYAMTGRILGSVSNILNSVAIQEGSFRFPVNSRSNTTDIEIVNDTVYPTVILSAAWTGFFNEISRQEQR